MSRVQRFEAHSCTSSKRRAQITLLSKVPTCFHFRLVHLHLGQQGELPTDPLLLLILTTKRPCILPPQWNIEPSYRIFPLSTITLAMSLISCTEDSDSSGYYSRISERLLALSVSDVPQSLFVILYQSLNKPFLSLLLPSTVWDQSACLRPERRVSDRSWFIIRCF